MGEIGFVSSETQQEFTRLMSKTVFRDRGFLPSPDDGELAAMVQERGWETFCAAPEPVPLAVVREFYATVKEARNGFSTVRGHQVDYRAEAIRRTIGARARDEDEEDWMQRSREEIDLDKVMFELCIPGTKWKQTGRPIVKKTTFPASQLSRYAKAWNAFICSNIMPSSHTHDVTVDRAILLYGIVTDRYIDLAPVIYQGMLRFMRGGTTGAIPYGAMVTKLCRASGVRWPETEQLQAPGAPIDHSAILRMAEWNKGEPHPRGYGYIFDEATGGHPLHSVGWKRRKAAAGPSHPGGSREVGDVHFRRLARTMDAMHTIHQRFASDLTQALDRAFHASGVTVPWPVIGADMQYPPPDSPLAEEGNDSDSE